MMNGISFAQARLYETGDYVYPTDLPRRHLCRVAATDEFDAGGIASQILKLEPIAGPWPGETRLIRLNSVVVPAWKPGWRGPQARRPESLAAYRGRKRPARQVG